MNVLPMQARVAVIAHLVEGTSLRATVRLTDVHRDTVGILGLAVGQDCARLHDRLMRNLCCDLIEADEMWTFVGKKPARCTPNDPPEYGDRWVWVAIDPVRKLVPTFHVGNRDGASALAFATDLRMRVLGRPQITTNGRALYIDALQQAFGTRVHHAQSLSAYQTLVEGAGGAFCDGQRYTRGDMLGHRVRRMYGNPDLERATTAHSERQNLTVRMQQRRFTRLTNAFSKRAVNLDAAVALHYAHYNLCRIHESIRRVTPAMEAGVTNRVWSIEELIIAALATPREPPAVLRRSFPHHRPSRPRTGTPEPFACSRDAPPSGSSPAAAPNLSSCPMSEIICIELWLVRSSGEAGRTF